MEHDDLSMGRRLEAEVGKVSMIRAIGSFIVLVASLCVAQTTTAQDIVVDAAVSDAVNSFSPVRALGGAVDRQRGGNTQEEIEKHTQWVLSGSALKELLGTGWQTVTYRQNTELHIEAWHWNPRGTWSDPSGKGYFTGNATPGEPIRHSYGY